MNRSIQVEGAFGVLKSDYEFNRFLTSQIENNCLIMENIKEAYLIVPKIQESLNN
jgi:hypothetical protein